ncbi:c-type cytochrome [Candidatus Binatia bacterium]|nr:c-type cytochrome [Candidatus Binatia bacterium]
MNKRPWIDTGLALIAVLCATIVAGCSSDGGSSNNTPEPTPTAALTLRYPQFPPMPEPPDDPANPSSMVKLELGTYLFFDPRLSTSGRTACNNCHVFNTSFQDNLVKPRPDTSQGDDFFTLKRNTESLFNIVYREDFFRDGKVTELAPSLTEPWVEDNQQLGKTHELAAEHLTEILRGIDGYKKLFRDAYGLDVDTAEPHEVFETAGRAFAVWVRQVVSRNSPFDRWNAGDDTAIDESAQRGAALFAGKAGCFVCHTGPNFTDNKFHNISSAVLLEDGSRDDEGRSVVTGLEADRGKFQTPSLRHAARTTPYFHDGSRATLLDVIKHFDSGAGSDPNHDPVLGRPLGLTSDEMLDLISFIRALRGESVVLWGPKTPLYTQAEVDELQRELLPR